MINKRNNKGFTLLEVLVATAILVFTITAALHVYLNSSFLVAQSKNKTRAVTHAKVIAEEIRSWDNITNQAIAERDWLGLLAAGNDENLLPGEGITVQSADWIQEQSTSPRRVTINITWEERGRNNSVILVGGVI